MKRGAKAVTTKTEHEDEEIVQDNKFESKSEYVIVARTRCQSK